MPLPLQRVRVCDYGVGMAAGCITLAPNFVKIGHVVCKLNLGLREGSTTVKMHM